MKYLVVVAHPDDEVLGMGATIYRLTQSSHEVCVLTLVAGAENRSVRGDDLDCQIAASSKLLGVTQRINRYFPDANLNMVSHRELEHCIEEVIESVHPDVIVTHFPGDTHSDHQIVSKACQEAFRVWQRSPKSGFVVPELTYMEVPSSTEWSVGEQFQPNTFFEVGLEAIEKKLESLKHYRGVVKAYPHPRSSEAIKALAAYRGCQSGYNYAEAFQTVFRRI